MSDLAPFLLAVGVFAVAGVGIGMLVARRLDRWVGAQDDEEAEEPGDPDRPDA